MSGAGIRRDCTSASSSGSGITRDLIFNGEFHKLIGGPKWVSEQFPQRACFRKYFGVRGRGDFLLVTSHPREVSRIRPRHPFTYSPPIVAGAAVLRRLP